MSPTTPDNDATSWFTISERMHSVAAAYDVTLPRMRDEKLRGQLQNFADENQQHLDLLQQRLAADKGETLVDAAKGRTAQAAAWLDAKQIQLGAALGVTDLFKALAEREQALVQAIGERRQAAGLGPELTQLLADQASCAKARARWLADPRHAAMGPAQKGDGGVTDEARRGVMINSPSKSSAENSDC